MISIPVFAIILVAGPLLEIRAVPYDFSIYPYPIIIIIRNFDISPDYFIYFFYVKVFSNNNPIVYSVISTSVLGLPACPWFNSLWTVPVSKRSFTIAPFRIIKIIFIPIIGKIIIIIKN